ncbi:NADH dehydrogenase [ubiquinone] 1 alpha subcomplex assembly factor 7 [Tistlia consotensis]|uniref:NADH dehydrogenase [ubiquinone] 1 alpha subcomplex assembly factor 7 n=1 Tax=Tistlia consotensis USBA 355 TaxID=560819 RepID=A0A1Y6C532_9PROT|nr:SAM-dependent methyltransferase [Tistlia consotensis]SMF46181.1 NADH dehydrogenase [ubiquinone] 1 alpha subcomplex assembly factor 7 [Tistlia consotensis USBA 355]SNR78793.1 NADH dehydrogenase [ubiquinone] 1 alpha subcomplex assembly factor 7 [Tistlia consotensis]
MSSPLLALLAARIRAQGPLSLAEYMAVALGHPRHGYYATRDPLARDFTTAPEISQMFGELLGLWLVERWQALGSPPAVRLVELGPGRGTLMADLLRAARLVPGFLTAAELHLVETSPVLRERQRQALAGQAVQWQERFEQVPDGPLLLVANELFDALPIRQFQRTARGWAERQIGLSADGGGLAWGLGPELPEAALPGLPAAGPGEIAEVSPAGQRLAASIGERLARQGGAALILDYGYAPSQAGDTLQALRGARPADPLDAPGEADLTAHVDFAALAAAAGAAGARAWGPVGQGAFLEALGIRERAAILQRGADEGRRAEIAAALARLTAPKQMGHLFKALALTGPDAPAPAGFPVGG